MLLLLTLPEFRLMLRTEFRRVLIELGMLKLAQQEETMDVAAAAAYLKLSVPTVYGLTSRQLIPHYRRARRLVFVKSELREWLESGRQGRASQRDASTSNQSGDE